MHAESNVQVEGPIDPPLAPSLATQDDMYILMTGLRHRVLVVHTHATDSNSAKRCE